MAHFYYIVYAEALLQNRAYEKNEPANAGGFPTPSVRHLKLPDIVQRRLYCTITN